MSASLTYRWIVLSIVLLSAAPTESSGASAPPCDRYPVAQHALCEQIWKQLNDQALAEVAQFGLAQQKRRDAGQITPEQHLTENLAFIKQSTDQRLKRLHERMSRK